jgi:hypothetical protein
MLQEKTFAEILANHHLMELHYIIVDIIASP